ncbi:putative reverse transcriptase zinc-binding domain-containing protein [Helianthus annuus]|nr:putative reverse transcriptase zinc-binding domain-containing protein [Helianthus annuus]
MNLPDVLCKTCGATEETSQHILIECNFAKRVWEAITDWLKIPMVNTDRTTAEWLSEISEIQRSRKIRKVIHAIVIEAMSILWKTRNEKAFSGRQGGLQTVIEDVKEASFQGLKQRSKYGAISRLDWWDFNLSL